MRRLGWICLAVKRGTMTTLWVVREGDRRDEDGVELEKRDTR